MESVGQIDRRDGRFAAKGLSWDTQNPQRRCAPDHLSADLPYPAWRAGCIDASSASSTHADQPPRRCPARACRRHPTVADEPRSATGAGRAGVPYPQGCRRPLPERAEVMSVKRWCYRFVRGKQIGSCASAVCGLRAAGSV